MTRPASEPQRESGMNPEQVPENPANRRVAAEPLEEWERDLVIAAAEAAEEQRFADYWGGAGPEYEAKAAENGRTGPDREPPWWDGERMHGGDWEPEPELEAGG